MFERFTDSARRVVVLAQLDARTLNHNYIGKEHILLGLIDEGEGLGARALQSLGISLETTRSRVEKIIGQGMDAPTGHIPFTPRAKRVLELSLREAFRLGHDSIGTEHILLGLLREDEGVAAQVLHKLGADLNRVRQHVIELSDTDAPVGARISGRKRLLAVREIDEELAEVRTSKELALDEGDFELAARLRDLERRLRKQRAHLEPESES